MATVVGAYYGIQVTLADTAVHNLLTLLQAVDSSLNGVLQNCQTLKIQADDSNGANTVYVGDSNVSTSRFGYRILTHDQVPYSLISYQVPLAAIWVLASAATCKLNVEITF
jgi:hypothetical protein